MTTRAKSGIFKPKSFLAHTLPNSVTEALNDPHWKKAMLEEYEALVRSKTWTLVPLPSNRKAIGSKWLFRVKENPDGSIQRYKARLVAQGLIKGKVLTIVKHSAR